MAPTITIVMPCLNAAGTISRSLDSIRQQDVSDVEVVVVDGGSTDGTVELLSQRSDVRWTSEPDEGLSDAYNKGAAAAEGEILGWLNADDVYLPGALAEVQTRFAARPEAVWLTGRCRIVDGEGHEIRRPVTHYKNALLSRYSYALHLTQNFVSAPATFVRRDAFLQSGGLDVGLRYSMDYDLYLRLGRDHRPIIVERPLADFTMAPGTLSMSGFEKQFVEHRGVSSRFREDAPLAYAANAIASRGIITVYRILRWRAAQARS